MAVHEYTAGSTTVIMTNQTPQYPTQPYQGQPYQGQPYQGGYPVQPYGQPNYVGQPNQLPPIQDPPQQNPIIIQT